MAGKTEHPVEVAGFMMGTAVSHEERGNIFQAIYAYFNIIKRYPDSEEAKAAYQQLVGLARRFEKKGQTYMAKHLYQRIEDALGL